MLNVVALKNFRFGVWLSEFDGKRILSAAQKDGAPKILVLPFIAFPELDLAEEITGEQEYLLRLSEVSKESDSVVFCGVRTRILNVKHIGAAVCNKGVLADIADRTSNPFDDEYQVTNKIKVFAVDSGRIGLLVDADCLLELNWQKTAPHADMMLCINRGNSETAREEVRLFSAAYKIPYLYVDDGGLEWKE